MLRERWSLRGWSNTPFALADRIAGLIYPLNAKEFYVAESCDGETDFNALAFLPEHLLILDELVREGMVEDLSEPDPIHPKQRYRKAHNPVIKGIDWSVTGHCNLNCRHCFMESPSGKFGELPFEDMVSLIDQFVEANVLQVAITGGEPFIREDILDILKVLADKRIWVSQIYSNGLLVTPEHLRKIKELGLLPAIQISFDGVGKHDLMRGVEGIEAPTVEAIRMIRDEGFAVVVSTAVDRMSLDALPATYALMKELGIVSWRVSVPQRTGNWRESVTALELPEMVDVSESILRSWNEDGRPFYIQLAGFYSGKPGAMSYEEEMAAQPTFSEDDYDCVACREQANLLPDGTLMPCPGYVDTSIQDRMQNLLTDFPLSEVWRDSPLRDISNIRKKELLLHNAECAECEWFRFCGIGCRAAALSENGELLTKDSAACQLWKGGYKARIWKIMKAYAAGSEEATRTAKI